MESAIVLTEPHDDVLLITLNRPAQRNAVNSALAEGVNAAIDALDDSPHLRVGVLTGAGKGFCAGMDLKAFVEGDRAITDRGFAGIVERPPRKPLIAAVEGFALAGGFEIALACDLIVAAQGAKLGIPEAKRGLVAAAGGLLRLPRRVPLQMAMEMALTGNPIEAERGAEIGLVNRLAEPGNAVEEALVLASEIAANGPLATAASKRILVDSQDWPGEQLWQRQRELTDPILDSEDAREGALAFSEKRQAIWRGR